MIKLSALALGPDLQLLLPPLPVVRMTWAGGRASTGDKCLYPAKGHDVAGEAYNERSTLKWRGSVMQVAQQHKGALQCEEELGTLWDCFKGGL